jgi:hypothetical protein
MGTLVDVYFQYRKDLKTNNTIVNILNEEENENLIETEIVTKEQEPFVLFKFLICFSLSKNSMKVFNLSNTEGQLACLNGIRFLSIGLSKFKLKTKYFYIKDFNYF